MPPVGFPEDPHQGVAGEAADNQGRLRDQAGRQRDTAAARRDDISAYRDQAADDRDHAARRRDQHYPGDPDTEGDILARVRQAADIDRRHAHADRTHAANDRADAAADRQQALADRMAAARDRRQAGVDGLTGAYQREAGLLELHRDLSRTSRTGQLLVVAFVDVDHLKTINDTYSHAAGDRALTAVAHTLLAALRPYDLVIRYGGDEFLCAAEGIDLHEATLRFARINDLLNKAGHQVSVTVGLAELRAGETIDQVIGRADMDLYQQRSSRPD